MWNGVGSTWCADEHQRLSRLLVLIHSRKAVEPSSDMEQIIVAELTHNDQVFQFSLISPLSIQFFRLNINSDGFPKMDYL